MRSPRGAAARPVTRADFARARRSSPRARCPSALDRESLRQPLSLRRGVPRRLPARRDQPAAAGRRRAGHRRVVRRLRRRLAAGGCRGGARDRSAATAAGRRTPTSRRGSQTTTSPRWCSPRAAPANRRRTKSPGGRWRCRRAYCRLRLGERAVNVVVTVPPQHMYGLETSIFTLLAGDWALHDGNAFYPDEIAAALARHPRAAPADHRAVSPAPPAREPRRSAARGSGVVGHRAAVGRAGRRGRTRGSARRCSRSTAARRRAAWPRAAPRTRRSGRRTRTWSSA